MLLAGLILLAYLLWRRRSSLKLSKKQLLSVLLLSVLSMYLTNAFEFWALNQKITAAKACFAYSLSPFLAVLFSYWHFKEKMNKRKWLGMLIGFAGMIPVFCTQSGGEELLSGIISLPVLAIMAAAFCWKRS